MLKDDKLGQATHFEYKYVWQAMLDYKTYVQIAIYMGWSLKSAHICIKTKLSYRPPGSCLCCRAFHSYDRERAGWVADSPISPAPFMTLCDKATAQFTHNYSLSHLLSLDVSVLWLSASTPTNLTFAVPLS